MKFGDYEIPTEFSKTISNVFDSFVTQQLDKAGIVKMGPQPTGNLSQAQINAGMTGGPAPTLNANASGLMNSFGFGTGGSSGMLMTGLIAAGLGLGLYLVLKK